MLEKTLESPLDTKEIQPVHPKGNQSWIFTGRTDAKAKTPVLWPPDVKSWLIWKDPDAGKDWRREEKGMTEDEMVGWHHWLDGHEFEQTLEMVMDSDTWRGAWSPWGHKESDTTEQLNWTDYVTCGLSLVQFIHSVVFDLCNIWHKEKKKLKAVLQGVDEKLEYVSVEITSQSWGDWKGCISCLNLGMVVVNYSP